MDTPFPARLAAARGGAPCEARHRNHFHEEFPMQRCNTSVRLFVLCFGSLGIGAGCATFVDGHERALFFSASSGLAKEPVPGGLYFHWPWNEYITHDLRWTLRKEKVDITSKDRLHINIDVAVTVRPDQRDLYSVETELGPKYYENVVRAAIFGGTRAAAARFTNFEMVTRPKEFEHAIQNDVIELLSGKRVEVSKVAIEHLDLPPDVVNAANSAATAKQMILAREAERELAEREGRLALQRTQATLEAEGLQRRLKGEQALEEATIQIRIETEKRKAEAARVQAEAEAITVRADAEARATSVRAEAEKKRIMAISQNLSSNYVRIQALEALSKTVSAPGTKMMVLPVGKDGLPSYLTPFLNPFGPFFGALAGNETSTGTREKNEKN
jgi:regulator of protease activity HflC (stomatin/prohibitin superfamily)